MELLNANNQPYKNLAGAKTGCRTKGLDPEKVKLDEESGNYYYEDSTVENITEEMQAKNISIHTTRYEEKTFKDNELRLKDCGLETYSKDEVDEAIREAVEITMRAIESRKEKLNDIQEAKGSNLMISTGEDLAFLEKIKKQATVPIVMPPKKNSKGQYEDYTEHCTIKGKPQYHSVTGQPIMVPYREIVINGHLWKYYLTDQLGNIKTNWMPVDVAKIFADAHRLTFTNPATGEIYLPIELNHTVENVAEDVFNKSFTPQGSEKLVSYATQYKA